MSLIRLAVRMCTVRALSGATLAVSRVGDSQIEAINLKDAEERAPSIVVYTDDATVNVQGRDLLATTGSRDMSLTIEIVVAAQVEVPADPEGETEVTVGIPATDDGLELTIDLVHRQILRVLTASPDPWAELWRRFVLSVGKIEERRGASSEKGVRFAAREIGMSLDTVSEPGFGEAPTDLWADFINLVRSDEMTTHLADVIAASYLGASLSSWRAAQAELGLTDAGIRGMGLAPADTTQTGAVDGVDGGEAAELIEIDLADIDKGGVRPIEEEDEG